MFEKVIVGCFVSVFNIFINPCQVTILLVLL